MSTSQNCETFTRAGVKTKMAIMDDLRSKKLGSVFNILYVETLGGHCKWWAGGCDIDLVHRARAIRLWILDEGVLHALEIISFHNT